MSRCTNGICQSANTKKIERTCRLVYNNGELVDCYISELWLCDSCGNPFKPSAMKIMPWHLRFKDYNKKVKRKIIKEEITKELFSQR